ncbi:MAG: T9SS type A sorting domain-containing protein [bacterium]
MRYLYLIIFSLFTIQVMADDQVRGMTENLPLIQNFTVEKNENGFRRIISENNPIIKPKITDEIPWILSDEQDIDITIPPKGFGGFMIEQYTNKLIPLNSYIDNPKISQAIAKSPKWLRNRLQLNLSLLTGSFVNTYSDMIINAEEPYIDEIAFVVANTSVDLLMSKYFYPDLIVQNAKSVYTHDADLKYVDIVEYGSMQNGDYYSTVVYKRKNLQGQEEQIEVPYEIYYWYIVYPKLSDEIPTYVNPSISEVSLSGLNHTLNITAPDKGGVFWRDYLYDHTEKKADTEEMYPILKDMASAVDYLWDESSTDTKTAIGELTSWVKATMSFTSKTERPHQPVRIYKMHIGRCGEHEDLTNAIARACLIPSRGISAISEDHVWNEFWDKDWQQWEPVNTSYYNKAAYGEKGWGKLFGSVYARRGDGVTFPVTDQGYSENTAPMTIKVVDENKVPIDGAYVMLCKRKPDAPANEIYVDSYGITNFQGEYKFVVGYKNTYFARIETQYGNSPAEDNNVMMLIENALKDKKYEFEFEIPNAKPIVSGSPKKAFENEDYKLTMDYQASNSTNWLNYMDDIANLRTYWSTDSKTGSAFMLLNENEYNNLKTAQPFSYADNNYFQCSDGTFDVSFQRWWYNYALFYNGYNSKNPMEMKAHAKLWKNPATSVKSESAAQVNVYPTPAHDFITVTLKPSQGFESSDGSEIQIYNTFGEKVMTIEQTQSSSQQINISTLPNGTYFLKVGKDIVMFVNI